MAELLVKAATTNLHAAIARLAAMAAWITLREARDAMEVGRQDRAKGWLAFLIPNYSPDG